MGSRQYVPFLFSTKLAHCYGMLGSAIILETYNSFYFLNCEENSFLKLTNNLSRRFKEKKSWLRRCWDIQSNFPLFKFLIEKIYQIMRECLKTFPNTCQVCQKYFAVCCMLYFQFSSKQCLEMWSNRAFHVWIAQCSTLLLNNAV